jgi:hypothetical protein
MEDARCDEGVMEYLRRDGGCKVWWSVQGVMEDVRYNGEHKT